MRNIVLGAAVAALLATSVPAVAGGMYEGKGSLKDEPAPMPPVAMWAGLYVGGSLGFGVGDTSGELKFGEGNKKPRHEIQRDMDFEALTIMEPDYGGLGGLLSSEFDVDGAIYGAHIGYNWQHGHKVFGIEGAINGTDIDGSALCGPFAIATCERELNYYATLVGRLGYAMNSLLFYGFGGVAYGDVDTDVSLAGVESLFNGSTSHLGWTAGVGIEMALTERFIVGVEYAHVDLGEDDFNIGSGGDNGYYSRACVEGFCGGGGYSVRDEVDMDFDVIKVRASYKLGHHYREPLEPMK